MYTTVVVLDKVSIRLVCSRTQFLRVITPLFRVHVVSELRL